MMHLHLNSGQIHGKFENKKLLCQQEDILPRKKGPSLDQREIKEKKRKNKLS